MMKATVACQQGARPPPCQPQLVHLLQQCANLCRPMTQRSAAYTSHATPGRASGRRGGRACSTAAAVAAAAAMRPPAKRSQKRGRRRPPAPISVERTADMRPGQLLEVECDSLAFGGQGVCKLAPDSQPPELAHLHGFVVFTRGALPGERLIACVRGVQKGHAVAYKVCTVRTSPAAAEAPCPHFGPCGGCQHQDLQYAAQLAEKQAQVSAVLQRIAGVADISSRMRPIVGAAEQYHYRNKLEFTFSGQTWVPAEDGTGGYAVPAPALGFVRPGHPGEVLPIDTCWLQDAAANEILAAVKAGIADAHLQPQGARRDAAVPSLQRVAIRQGSSPDSGARQHMVQLTTGVGVDAAAALAPVVAAVRRRCPSVVSIVRTARGGSPPAAVDAPAEVLWGRPSISQELGGLRFDISARSFFQTNTAQAAQLTRMVAQAAGVRSLDTVVDLFCGAGFFALALASQCASVHGIESSVTATGLRVSDSIRSQVSPAAVADARANAARNGICNATFQQADLDRGMPAATAGAAAMPAPDVVIADPGRQGMSRRLLAWLAGCGARRLVYVSCNPATQARDLAFLLGTASDSRTPTRFRLDYVQACDMFPQTSHVEVMAVLSCIQEPAS